MSRNGSGTYSVPNSFTPATTISSSAVNANFTDAGDEITNSVAADGQTTLTGALKGANGSAAAPAYGFASDPNTGMYRKGADSLGFATAGSERVYIDDAGKLFALDDIDVAGDAQIDGALTVTGDITGHVIGTDVQAHDDQLDDIAALTPTDGNIIVGDGSNWVAESGATARASLGIAALPAVNALVITNNSGTPTTSIDIDADNAILLDTSNNAILISSVNLTVACAGTGANGLDAGSLANNTWYNLFIISNGTTTAGLASTSATTPTMPSGYTYKYRVGAIRTGGSATFTRVRQVGNRAQYVVVTGSTTPNYPIMASGVAGNRSNPTYVAVATGSYVPPTAPIIQVRVHAINGTTMVSPNDDTGAFDDATNSPFLVLDTGSGAASSNVAYITLETSDLFWVGAISASRLACLGWVDAVNAN
jgi:hypothetical protein